MSRVLEHRMRRQMARIRRRKPRDDDRLDYNDPAMPVLRPWLNNDGTVSLRAIPPEDEQEHCAEMVEMFNPVNAPHWRRDPTYKMRKR